MSSDDELAEQIVELQKKKQSGDISEDEYKTQMEFLQKKFELNKKKDGGDEEESVPIFKTSTEKKEEEEPAEEVEAKFIKTPSYKPRTTRDLEDIEKRIDRLKPEHVDALRKRYLEKYGEDLVIPDIYEDKKEKGLIADSYFEHAEPDDDEVRTDTPAEEEKPEGLEAEGESKGFGAIFKRFKKKKEPAEEKATFELADDEEKKKPKRSKRVKAEKVEKEEPEEEEEEVAETPEWEDEEEGDKKPFIFSPKGQQEERGIMSFGRLPITGGVRPTKVPVFIPLAIIDIPLYIILIPVRLVAKLLSFFIVFDDEDDEYWEDDEDEAVVAEVAD